MHSAMDLLTRSIWISRSSADLVGRSVTLGRQVITLVVSSSGTRDATKLRAVRSDLAPVTVLLSKVEELEVGFLGTL